MVIKILLFNDVELLDFAGPLEVFTLAQHFINDVDLNVSTLAFENEIRISKTGLKLIPETINNFQKIDLLILPGGIGTRAVIKNSLELEKLNTLISQSKQVASVCTGALILGKLGYLKDLKVTTHKNGIDELIELDPSVTILENERFVDNGNLLTSAGISAGIDMSLHLVQKHFGQEIKDKIITHMEYYSKTD